MVNRFGKDELAAWVDMPLPKSAGCLELSERKIIADEDVRRLMLGKSGASSVTDFQSLSREWKKEVVSGVCHVMQGKESKACPSDSYSLIYKLNK